MADLVRHSLNGATMGTRYSALFYAAADVDLDAIGKALFQRVDRVDRQMSTWKAESDLSRLNASPVGIWVALPAEILDVLACGVEIGTKSGKAFDMAVLDLVNDWGFGPEGPRDLTGKAFEPQERPRPSASTGLEIDRAGLRARRTLAIELDLCGIAKGFGVDEMARCLEMSGFADFLVGIDGEMRARGAKPDGIAWSVALERPVRGERSVMGVVELSDAAIATSGDYRHFRDIAEGSIAHTMDPRTGLPLRNDLASVSVISKTCMEADAWATALMVMGADRGPDFARQAGLNALFLRRAGDGLEEIAVGPLWG